MRLTHWHLKHPVIFIAIAVQVVERVVAAAPDNIT